MLRFHTLLLTICILSPASFSNLRAQEMSICDAYSICADAQCAASDNLADLQVTCRGDNFSYSGSSAGFTVNLPGAGNACSVTVENNQWIGFIAPPSETLISLTTAGCASGAGLEMLLFEIDCAGDLSAPLFCESVGSNAALFVAMDTLCAGRTYALMIDGIDGAVCDFDLSVSADASNPDLMVNSAQVQGPSIFCSQDTLTFRVEVPFSGLSVCGGLDQIQYEWLVDAVPTPQIIGSSNADSIRLVITPSGLGTGFISISAVARTNCSSLAYGPAFVAEQPAIPYLYGDVFYCMFESVIWQDRVWFPSPGEMLEVTYPNAAGCDSVVIGTAVPIAAPEAPVFTTYCCLSDGDCPPESTETVVFPDGSYTGCDSLETYEFVNLPPIPPTDLGAIVLEDGEIYTYDGVVYTTADIGDYSVSFTSFQGCDSLVTFSIELPTSTRETTGMNRWSAAPNPTTGALVITISESLPEGTRLRVYDALGQERLTAGIKTGRQVIDVSNLPLGTYYLRYHNRTGKLRARSVVRID